ncbi:type II secretion system protein GspC [Bowmanella dokdonensis]|uniref:Type II secretion system protein GspC n=1 Tax=Bowmanella dokdonensis TaxID=751969 RepID=A0A939DJ40_9ALTE|nr:type II secretion system protein GspC [Bowmanella dokdonensis]MBN7823654.1 type II secretion system protein GspC [Bowmanella dokdonensis]
MSQYQEQIIRLICLLLGLYLIAFAADLTWRLWPVPETAQQSQTTLSPVETQAKASADIRRIQQLDLFGKPQANQPKVVVEEAPQTDLNLTLTGVVASDNPDRGAAIIENRGKQNTYGIGEKVDGTNAVVQEVYPDRIIIKNGPRAETLMLDGVDFKQSPSGPAAEAKRAPAPAFERRSLSQEAVEATQALQAQPANFTDYIAISQHMVDGELKGYRVSPGRNPALFQAAGLQANDIVTEINGLDLTDIQQSVEAMSMLRETESLQLTVDREGELLTLYLDLPSDDSEL